jgi:hypothetical protein
MFNIITVKEKYWSYNWDGGAGTENVVVNLLLNILIPFLYSLQTICYVKVGILKYIILTIIKNLKIKVTI